jgi:hypothetical protein
MTGDSQRLPATGDGMAVRARPLLPDDPRRLGRYDLLGRLGEGGMGTVYLAATPAGRVVAVKIIRPEFVHDGEFRRRFRGEVNRARQVPPFCTAEVLDADPDHEQPYLVVEYVDGPSLESVVTERGPLTPANLHGLAIGVATALAAIHGAGVIHRDLKPTNVLLAPGSPKVIDFGIARAVHGADELTRTDQMIGTVAYMAPERFTPGGATMLTPAADIFAWGAVVAYAGTGRTPFEGESSMATAARIMTQPPDLTGLGGPLRGLIEQALAKDPADRPTARELLDRLLTTGLYQPADLAAALVDQPALLEAAQEARSATRPLAGRELTAEAPAPGPVARVAAAGHATTRFGDRPPTAAPPGPPADPAPRSAILTGSGRYSRRNQSRSPGRRRGRIALVLVALVAVVASALVAGRLTGVIALPGQGRTPHAHGSAAPTGTPSTVLVARDSLASENLWHTRDDPDNQATCTFAGALLVTKQSPGSYRCPGPVDPVTDFSVYVDVKLLAKGSCASVWFRFDSAGYALRICADGYSLVTHGVGLASAITPLHTFPFTGDPIALDTVTRVGVSAHGTDLTFHRDGRPVGTWRDATFLQGRVVLGIFQDKATDEPPFRVSFANVEIRAEGR